MTVLLDDEKIRHKRVHQVVGYLSTHVGLALILLVAASLKAHQLITVPVIAHGITGSRPFLIALVELELLVGTWLLSGLWPRTARLVAGACFAVFAVFNVWMISAGHASCGCFGRIDVDPRLTLALDVAALVVVIVFFSIPAAQRSFCSRRFRLTIAAAIILAIGLPVGILAAKAQPAPAMEETDIAANGSLVVLEPQKWVGTPCPLLKYIDVGAQLNHGTWRVLLYHHDCPACQAAVSKSETEVQTLQPQDNAARVALIEVPPYGDEATHNSGCVHGRLDSTREWFVQTPVWLRISDNVVTGIE